MVSQCGTRCKLQIVLVPEDQTSVEPCFMLCSDASQAMRLRDVDDLLWPTVAVRKRSRSSLTVVTGAAFPCRFSGGGRSGSGTIGHLTVSNRPSAGK